MQKKSANRQRGCRAVTEAKYRPALQLYTTTDLSKAEICRRCGITVNGFARYIGTYHRDLLLRRNGIRFNPEEAANITLKQRRGQRPATHAKYKEAIEACDSMEYIQCNISEIAREFGLNGTNLANQLRKHYPGLLEYREKARKKLGIDDGLPRGMRTWTREQYADAVDLLRSDRYVTVKDAAEKFSVSYTGLEQHLIFYYPELVDNRIDIRKKAVRSKRKGELTGRGTIHAPSPEAVEKYAEALNLFKTTSLPARKIAKQTGVSIKGFYEYLQKWHKDLICQRKGIVYEEDRPVDWSSVRRYNPATAEKYSGAIAELKKGGKTIAAVADEFGFRSDALRQYIKEHEPELSASLGRVKTESGKHVSSSSMEKYKEAIHLCETTSESIKSIAQRLGHNESSLRQFIKRQFSALLKRGKV